PLPFRAGGTTADDPWARATAVARAIKRAVHAATGLTCSIAIARNKLLAKIASELDKPDGLTLLRDEDVERRIWPLAARKIDGVSDDLRRKGYVCKTIGLKIRYGNFKTVTRDCTIETPTQHSQTIRRVAGECLKRVPLERRIRLLGVRVAGLAEASSPPSQVIAAEPNPTLFD